MDRKNYITCFCVIVCLNCFLYAENDNLLEQFGATEGKSVNNGFVFMDGRYIESPYIVSSRGLSLYVNNIKIPRPARYAGLPVIGGYENPASLSLEEKQKLFRQLEATRDIYEKYLNREYGYLFFSKGGHVRLSPQTVAYDLPGVIKLLTSDKTRDEKLTELLPQNWHLSGDMVTFVDNFHVTAQLSPRLSQLAEKLLMVDEYGTMSGTPVNRGFIFIGGQYIETPYRVERRGLGVFINNKMIGVPLWVPDKIFSGDIDPQWPKEINSETCFDDEVVKDYLAQKQAYLHKHKTREEEAVAMAQVFKSLPCIIKALVDENEPHTIHIETNDGISFSAGLISLGDRGVKYDKESVTERVDSERKNYQERLEKGDCYMLWGKSGKISFSAGSINETLPKMADIVNANISKSQKISEMRQAGINMADEELAQLIANFPISLQLHLRIEKLKEVGDTNGKEN
jgi:hypothetical protein